MPIATPDSATSQVDLSNHNEESQKKGPAYALAHLAELYFRYNNRANPDMFGEEITGSLTS